MTAWEYCILTRLSAELDTKWHVNRVFQHSENALPEEVTAARDNAYNQRINEIHAQRVYPILPAVLNMLGADGWELIDDMQTGTPGGEGLVFKRPLETGRVGGARKVSARKGASKKAARKASAKKGTRRGR